jgi:uncharacterized membrane protein
LGGEGEPPLDVEEAKGFIRTMAALAAAAVAEAVEAMEERVEDRRVRRVEEESSLSRDPA